MSVLKYLGLEAPSDDELFGKKVNFKPGYYWTFIDTDAYSEARTPLDDALKTGLVRLVRAPGVPGGKMFLLIHVADGFGGKFAWFLGNWAEWKDGKPSLEVAAEQSGIELRPEDDWTDAVLDVRRKAGEVGRDVSKWVGDLRKGFGKWLGWGLVIGGGLWWWSASRRRR